MSNIGPKHMLLLCVLSTLVVGCSSQSPHPYSQIDSSRQMRLNDKADAYSIPYRYMRPVDWGRYQKIMLEPVVIYEGSDNQFGDMQARDKRMLANEMTSSFSEALGRYFRFTSTPSDGTLDIRITLTGAATTTPGLSTFSRFDIGMGSYNLVQSMRGHSGTFTGSVTYAVEIYDASTSQLLESYITRQYPTVYDISSTFGAFTAAKTGIGNGAQRLAESLSSRKGSGIPYKQ